jgi:Uma2 family endonuclease
MATTTLIAPKVVEPEPCLVLYRIGWDQYLEIARALPEQPNLRMTYVDGRLTLLSPLRHHDWVSRRLSQLVVAVADSCGILWEDAGGATFRREEKRGGVEGDETFYFGEHAKQMRGSKNIDLTTQPPPDLAIEVEVTHPADDSMLVYGRLGVPEVWRVDVTRETVGFWVRQDDGTYAAADRSQALPLLEPVDILEQLRLAEELGSALWNTQLGGWVRDVLLPRRGGV